MNKRIVLISCVTKKLKVRAKVKDLYVSPLFKKSLAYAQKLQPDEIFVLSAKYGLLSLNQEIEPYEKSLNNMLTEEIKEWARKVLIQLKEISLLDETEFTILAGEKYRKHILPHIKYHKIPLMGFSIGKQLKRLKELTI